MMWRVAGLILAALPVGLLAQDRNAEDEPAFVEQAEGSGEAAGSPVYWPERITRDRVEAARAVQAQQLDGGEAAETPQLTSEAGGRAMTQLSTGDASGPLAQLSEAERQVLLEAIEGTDICARETQIAAIRQLCAARLETRSADFRPRTVNALSPEERLLGEGLGDNRAATLERVIARLGRASPSAEDPGNQAIAAMALDRTGPPAREPDEDAAGSNLSPETRALIEAIVNQVPGGSGGR